MKGKIKIFGAILVVLAVIIVFIFYQNTKGPKAELLELKPQTIANTFQEEGRVLPKVEYPVHSILTGEIVNLEVEEGQWVEENDVLVVVDAVELEFQLRQLKGELKSLQGEKVERHQESLESKLKSQELSVEQARANLRFFEDDFERMKKLYDEGAVAAKEYENAENMLKTAQFNLKQQQEALTQLNESSSPTSGSKQFYTGRIEALESQIDLIKYRLEKSRIVAPISGVIANLSIRNGDLVGPELLLMSIFREDDYIIEVFVLAEFATSISKGMKVEIVQEIKGEDITFQGVVKKVAPTAQERISPLGLEEQCIKTTIKPSVPQDFPLFPGSAVDVKFTIDKREDVLVVPKTALFPYKEDEALWKVENGKAVIQPVETGFENESHVIITKGLSIGDKIILNPQHPGLKEGKRIPH